SLQFFWNEKVWIGGGYRSGNTAFSLLEWQINKQFRLGYSYDMFTMSTLQSSGGSHEIFLGWNVVLGSQKSPSTRYFR
ncbi:MAG: type IX secretion system membrane protein PorP/SprF, partial [Flavobacteriales bacterium]|nr:type IX secretion system membrane protein PorP/SprF [Flavobacteriales bacterium]